MHPNILKVVGTKVETTTQKSERERNRNGDRRLGG